MAGQDVGLGLTGKRKAAALLVALGPEAAAQILKNLRDDEIDELMSEVVKIRALPQQTKEAILQETYEEAASRQDTRTGGADYAREVLARTVGTKKAGEMIGRAVARERAQPFDFIVHSDPLQVVTFLQNEHPQTIALVLAHLPAEVSSRILSGLELELQIDVASRLALMTRTDPDTVREVESVLGRRLASFANQGGRTTGGVDYLVQMLNSVDAQTERALLDKIEHDDPELAVEIQRRRFLFEDILNLDDRAVQKVIRAVDIRDLILALRGTSGEVAAKFYRNMSRRAGQTLRDDVANQGPVRLRLIEEARQRVVSVVRTLAEAQEINIAFNRDDPFI